MSDSLAQKAFETVNSTPEFTEMSPKARLEAFAWAYCRTVAESTDAEIAAEAAALGLPLERLAGLRELVHNDRAHILAEVLRIFGDRAEGTEDRTKLDKLLDDVLGTSGHEGTIPG